MAGTQEFPEGLGRQLAARRPDLLVKISDAQRAVLEQLLEGKTEPEIAESLDRSKHTVHDHTKAIYQLLGVPLLTQTYGAGKSALADNYVRRLCNEATEIGRAHV